MAATLLLFMTTNTRKKLVHIMIVTVGPLRKYIQHKYTLKAMPKSADLISSVIENLLYFSVYFLRFRV